MDSQQIKEIQVAIIGPQLNGTVLSALLMGEFTNLNYHAQVGTLTSVVKAFMLFCLSLLSSSMVS